MNLGALIERLGQLDPDAFIRVAADPSGGNGFVGSLHSYRGYYDHLALDHDAKNQITVRVLLAEAKAAVGKTFTGYKGGEYVMREWTPVWISNYGQAESLAITHIENVGRLALIHVTDIGDYA